MNFSQTELNPALLAALHNLNFIDPTPIQAACIPEIMAGKDIIACAQTGTGKTAAYALPLLHQLLDSPIAPIKMLVLTPTRELAIQVAENIEQYASETPLSVVCAYGGASLNPQRKAIMRNPNILVATPGRLFDLIAQGALSLANVAHLVIDEADRMLDMGFLPDVLKVKQLLVGSHQTLLFSATYSHAISDVATSLLTHPIKIDVTSELSKPEISQQALLVTEQRKAELLAELIGKNNWQQVLVFVSTKERAASLHKELSLDGIDNQLFHGDKTQGARQRALKAFKDGSLRVLVATDVAARGLDIKGLPRIINFQLPFAKEDYIHRIGRTGRAGMKGQAINLVSKGEMALFKQIEQLIGQTITASTPDGYEVDAPLPLRYQLSRQEASNKPQKFDRKRNKTGKGTHKQKGAKPAHKGRVR